VHLQSALVWFNKEDNLYLPVMFYRSQRSQSHSQSHRFTLIWIFISCSSCIKLIVPFHQCCISSSLDMFFLQITNACHESIVTHLLCMVARKGTDFVSVANYGWNTWPRWHHMPGGVLATLAQWNHHRPWLGASEPSVEHECCWMLWAVAWMQDVGQVQPKNVWLHGRLVGDFLA